MGTELRGWRLEEVIWTDECTVQIELLALCLQEAWTLQIITCALWNIYCTRMVYIDVLAPTYRPKHPTEVHVWAGISRRGSVGIYVVNRL